MNNWLKVPQCRDAFFLGTHGGTLEVSTQWAPLFSLHFTCINYKYNTDVQQLSKTAKSNYLTQLCLFNFWMMVILGNFLYALSLESMAEVFSNALCITENSWRWWYLWIHAMCTWIIQILPWLGVINIIDVVKVWRILFHKHFDEIRFDISLIKTL